MLPLMAAFSFCGYIIFHSIHIYCIFLILSSVDGHFGSFHVLVTVDNAAVSAGLRTPLGDNDFISCRNILRSGIVDHRVFHVLIFLSSPEDLLTDFRERGRG